jgi:hypothetical protein
MHVDVGDAGAAEDDYCLVNQPAVVVKIAIDASAWEHGLGKAPV